jgi:predicted SAM-dependent methyltransferase
MKLPAHIEWHGAKLHLGCGTKTLAGWINSDALAAPVVRGVVGAPDIVLDIERDLGWIPDNALAQIYYSHGVEHIRRDLLSGVLNHFHRILAVGGLLTLAAPDLLGILAQRFPDGNWEGALFGHGYSTDPPGLRHWDCFTFEKLARMLKSAGFEKLRKWKPEEYPDIHALNDFATINTNCSVLIEACK